MKLAGLSRWQWTTIFTMTVGYAGYYFCRSNLSVAGPMLMDEGLTKEQFGMISSFAVGFYTVGKFFNGIICDFVGGRRMFLIGMAGSIVCTFLFSMGSGLTFFIVVFSANRLIQSAGWGGLVKTASHWFSRTSIGAVMGILALSYLFGDVVARFVLGQVISMGATWQQMFWVAGVTLIAILVLNLLFLKQSPEDVGEPVPESNPENLFGDKGNDGKPESIAALLLPFVTSFSFWLVCLLSIGLTIIREAFMFWSPTYLEEVAGLSKGGAGSASALFPLFGGISIIVLGLISDRVTNGRRGAVMCCFLLPSVPVLITLALLGDSAPAYVHLVLISATGLFILGPYALLSGAISVDLGGKTGSASAAGLADMAGYLGATVFSGWGIGAIATRWGWGGAFSFLAGILVVTAVVALVYWYVHEIHPGRNDQHDAKSAS